MSVESTSWRGRHCYWRGKRYTAGTVIDLDIWIYDSSGYRLVSLQEVSFPQ